MLNKLLKVFKKKNVIRTGQARQGDLFLEAVKVVPNSATMCESPVVAHGEMTGHAHTLSGKYQRYNTVENGFPVSYVKGDEVSLNHNTHHTIALEDVVAEPTEWTKITRQREYDPLQAEKERMVKD